MSRRSTLVALALATVGVAAAADAPAPAPAPAARPTTVPSWTGNVDAYLGAKALDHDDWDPIEGQAAFGLLFDTRPRSWPISLCVHLLGSGGYDKDDTTDVKTTGSTSELQLGIKKVFGDDGGGVFRGWVAGGVAIVSAARRIDPPGAGSTKDDDSGVGGWLGGGLYWTIANHFNIGPMVELSAAKVTLFGQDIQAGGLDAGILLGYHW